MTVVFTLAPAFYEFDLRWLRGEVTAGRTVVRVFGWPFNFPLWGPNFGTGAALLDSALRTYSGQEIIVFGHSMGSQVAYKWLRDYSATAGGYASPANVSFILTGNPERRYGGLLRVPSPPPGEAIIVAGGVGITGDATAYTVTDVARQYDHFADQPNVANPSTAARDNAAASNNIHNDYSAVSLDAAENTRYTEGNITYVLAPTPLDPALRDLVEQSYNRPRTVGGPPGPTGGGGGPPVPVPVVTTVTATRAATDEIRRRRKALQRAKTEISLYTNIKSEEGLAFRGRLDVNDLVRHEWPMKKNVSAAGFFTVRASHYLAKMIAKIPNNALECKNIVVRVDRYGGRWRWSGVLHHWKVETKDGVDYLTASFNDDMQFLQFLLGPPNPILPLTIFQGPRDYFQFAPGRWNVSAIILLNLLRKEGNLWTLPDDPFDPEQWDDTLDWSDWQVHIKGVSFLTDSSLWSFIGSRMNTIDSVIADTLDDGQLALTYRRIFTGEGEVVTGLLDNNVKNGALVFEVTDRSGFTLPGGTFFNGTVFTGLVRSVLTWASDGVDYTLDLVADNESLYPDEYWQSSFLGSFASAPTVGIADSWFNDLQSVVTYSPATSTSIIVGGDNPTADAVAKLLIETIGNLLGYFLLFGFDSLGDIISDVVMPFLVGTILAWDEVEIGSRATNLGWVHLWETFQRGGEANNWSLAAIGAIRGGKKATDDQTSHTMVIDESTWLIPGLHIDIGDRMWSTSGALQRNMNIDLMFVNQVEEMNLSGDDTGASRFVLKCGQNKAALSVGERSANLFKRALTTLQDIGVRLVQ